MGKFISNLFLGALAIGLSIFTGSRTLDLRMLRKAISTTVLARFLAEHPLIHVKCNALEENENAPIRKRVLRLGLPAPLFTIDFERAGLDRATFTRMEASTSAVPPSR